MADLGEPVRDGIEIYGRDGFDPGDILIINFSDVCGQHLNNMVLYAPIFAEGRLVAFAANRAHWTDIGGRVSGQFCDGQHGFSRKACSTQDPQAR